MARLHDIISYLDTRLETSHVRDTSLNGLQIEAGSEQPVTKVALAVDAGESVMHAAVDAGAQLLIVHHGVLWDAVLPIRGPLARKVGLCLQRGLSLYASHLPLDAHHELGNNAELARFFGLSDLSSCFPYRGVEIGVKGTFTQPQSLESIVARSKQMIGALESPLVLPFGSPQIRSVGVVTGSGASALAECAQLGLDLLISGEPKQSAYHEAKELKINALFAGHYATETFGVRALGKALETEYQVKTIFVNQPTGI